MEEPIVIPASFYDLAAEDMAAMRAAMRREHGPAEEENQQEHQQEHQADQQEHQADQQEEDYMETSAQAGDFSNVQLPPLPAGADTAAFRVTGLTMAVPNPDYAVAVQRRETLLVARRRAEIGLDQARGWLRDADIVPSRGLLPDPALRKKMHAAEQGLFEIFADGTWLYRPEATLEQRSDTLGRVILDAVRAELTDTEVRLLTTLQVERVGARSPASAAKAAAVRQVVTNVMHDYNEVVVHQDFSRFPVTVEELHIEFGRWLDSMTYQAGERMQRARLPFQSDAELDEMDLYRSRLIETHTVQAMQPWLGEYLATQTRTAQTQAGVTDFSLPLQQQLRQTVANLFADGGVTPAMQARQESLKTADELIASYEPLRAAVRQTVEAEAIRRGILEQGVIADDRVSARVEALRAAADRLPEEFVAEALAQVAKMRISMEATTVATQAEARLLSIDVQLQAISPTIQAPLVMQRDILNTSSPMPLLRVRVEPTGHVNVQPAAGPEIVYEFFWLARPLAGRPGSSERIIAKQVGTRTPQDSFRLPVPTEPTVYRVVAARYVRGDLVGMYASDTATVRLTGICRRCEQGFAVGTQRLFGECAWRQHPMNADLVRQLKDDSNTVAAAGSLAAGFATLVPHLDDSVLDWQGRPIVANADLMTLGGRGEEALRQQYFTYEAVLTNMANRFDGSMRAVYGQGGLAAARTLFTEQARPVRRDGDPLLGAISTALVPPAAAALTAALATVSDIAVLQADLIAESRPGQFVQDVITPMRDFDAGHDAFVNRFAGQYFSGGSTTTTLTRANGDAAYVTMQDATLAAQRLLDVPVVAVLFVILEAPGGAALRNAVATQSELRFLRELSRRVSTFYSLYAAYAVSAEEPLAHRLLNQHGEGARIVFFGRPGSSTVRSEPLDASFRRESDQRAAVHVAQMTAQNMKVSTAWRYASIGSTGSSLTPGDAAVMFVDTTGTARLQKRIGQANDASRHLNLGYLREGLLGTEKNGLRGLPSRVMAASETQKLAAAFHAPMDVPLHLWKVVAGSPQGIAAAAQAAGQAVRRTSQGMVDWRDVHSYVTDQPSLYRVDFDAATNAARITQRGSERLRTGRNFAAIHQRITQLVNQSTTEQDAAKVHDVNRRIAALVTEYNVLAFFGPPTTRVLRLANTGSFTQPLKRVALAGNVGA